MLKFANSSEFAVLNLMSNWTGKNIQFDPSHRSQVIEKNEFVVLNSISNWTGKKYPIVSNSQITDYRG